MISILSQYSVRTLGHARKVAGCRTSVRLVKNDTRIGWRRYSISGVGTPVDDALAGPEGVKTHVKPFGLSSVT